MYIHGIDAFAPEDVVRVDDTFAPETTSLHVRPLGFCGMESYLLLGLANPFPPFAWTALGFHSVEGHCCLVRSHNVVQNHAKCRRISFRKSLLWST
jgi:hypothetical protein